MKGFIEHKLGLIWLTSLILTGLLMISFSSDTGAAGLPSGGLDSANSNNGSISGHVYQADGVTPVARANILCYDKNIPLAVRTFSDSQGAYCAEGLGAGSYQVSVTASGYHSEYYDNVSNGFQMTRVTVTPPDNVPDIDFALDAVKPVTVNMDCPLEVLKDRDFVVRICISEVRDLSCFQFDLVFDTSVLRVDDVTSGVVGSNVSPIDAWAQLTYDPNFVRVLGHVTPPVTLTGAGYLAEIHFHTIGKAGQFSGLNFRYGLIADCQGSEFVSVSWSNSSVRISDRGDVDGDGLVLMGDVTNIERIILKLQSDCSAADVNGDGEINMADVTKLERIILGLD